MVRTNRSSGATTATPASMDDIDLDVMFADDGDALFDGLDIDLDMDDITGGGGGPLDSSTRPNTSSYNRGVVSRPPPQTRPTSPGIDADDDDISRIRRKTKRKAKTPSFFEDDDDEYDEAPPNKKKRKGSSTSKAITANAAAMTKKKPLTKLSQDDISIPATKPPHVPSKARSKSATKSSSTGMPPPLARNGPWVPTTSSSSTSSGQNVAAAGQFGNRQKRPSGTSFPSLPKGGTSSAAAAAAQVGRIINKLPMARSGSETSGKSKSSGQQQQQPKREAYQPEALYCGLQPSPIHFYPFMPALPSEPVLKSRKVYGSVDRIHTSLVGYIHTPPITSSGIVLAKENEPLFHLLQEAFKDEKSVPSSVRLDSIGITIGELRHAITSMDKNRIISDLYGVCALIQRQHDFLKQNCENMERWCCDNFSKEDYAEVYAPSKKRKENDEIAAPLSVLKTFTKWEIKVRISFTGLKDPKMPAFALATFPPMFRPNDVLPEENETKQAPTKRKSQTASNATASQEGRTSEQSPPSTKLKPPPQPLSYANMKPPRRRKNVAEMIARAARELSKVYSSRIETTRRTIDRREAELHKILSQNSIGGLHTAGMWKWVESSGFFSDITQSDVEDRLQDFRSITVHDYKAAKRIITDQKKSFLSSGEGVDDSVGSATVFDRLQSLLIDVESMDDNDNDDELWNLANDSTDERFTISEFIDTSDLTIEERSSIVLRSFGFSDISAVDVSSTAVRDNDEIRFQKRHAGDGPNHALNGSSLKLVENKQECDDLDEVIAAMKYDLARVEEMNNDRVAFLESASSRYRLLKRDQQQRSEREASLIGKCHQMMRKSKELKAKSSALTRKDDSLALPW